MAVDPGIFKKYDIRGTAAGARIALDGSSARVIGRAFATYLQQYKGKGTVVVGRDNRNTSFELQDNLMNGLNESGCHVIDIGLVGTPLVYWHAIYHGDVGGVMVTGSHLASDQNGFKLSVGARNVFGDEIQVLRKLIENGRFHTGAGERKADHGAYRRYVDDLAGRIPAGRSLRVVVDAGNGVAGLFAPELVERWGHSAVEKLFVEPDGNFPNHQPNPQVPANMHDLSEAVRRTGADVGIAFDGDADRMGVVDENGEMIAADRLLALLALDMLERHPGAALVADVLSSQVLFDAVQDAGGYAFMAPSGHSLVKEQMRDRSALIGGEMSGHIFLGEDYYGFDDGFLVAGRLLQLLAKADKPLSALNAALPTLHSTPEYRPHCPDDAKQTVIDGVADRLSDQGEVVTVDGFRLNMARGWGILRASNTEPALSLRFEGETEADAAAVRDVFIQALRGFPQVDMSAFD